MQMCSSDEAFQLQTGKIVAATQRASTLTKQLLAFGRRQFLTPRLLDVGAIVHEMDDMVRCLMGAEIQLLIETPPGQGLVTADQGQLEQTILNLASNARDAMPSGGTMTLRVAQRTTHVEESEVRPGGDIPLIISETGMGRREENQ